jgi:hypothetical protein
MRRALLWLLGVAILALCSAPAFAGSINDIVLNGSGNATPVSFVGTGGGDFDVNFDILNLTAVGFGTLHSSGYYSIVNNGAVVMSDGTCGAGCWLLSQTMPLLFTYGTHPNGSNLLTGDLDLVDITQTALKGGIFNDALVVNFTATGGSLQNKFRNGQGEIQLTIQFKTSQSLGSLGKNQMQLAKVVSGAVFPVSEPASLAILGASLLGFVGLGKKKKLFAR